MVFQFCLEIPNSLRLLRFPRNDRGHLEPRERFRYFIMKIWKFLQAEHIFLDINLPDKESVFHFVADSFAGLGIIRDAAIFYEDMKKREQTMSTGIGKGIGIPHATNLSAKCADTLLLRLTAPIEYEALDKLPVDIILPIVVPENQTSLHLQLLAGISRLCRNPEFLKTVRQAEDSRELLEEIKKLEGSMAFH